MAKTIMNYKIETVDNSLLEVLREDYQKPLNEKRVAQIVAPSTRISPMKPRSVIVTDIIMSLTVGTPWRPA